MFLILMAAATAEPACPASPTLEQALARVDALPILAGYGAAGEAQAAFGSRLSRLHGQTSVQISPGVRWLPLDQLRPEGSVGLQHSATLADLGGARQRVSRAETAALAARADAEQLQRRLVVTERWVERWGAASAVALAAEQLKAARTLEAKLTAGRALGATSEGELLWARTGRQRLKLELIDAEGRAAEAGLALAAALGCAEANEISVAGVPWEAPPAEPIAPSAGSARIAVLRAQLSIIDDKQALAALKQRPTVTLGLSSEVDGANTARTLVSVGGSWNLFEGNYLARGQTAAERALVSARLEQASLAERHLFAAIAHELEHQREVLEVIEGELLPDSEALERATQAAFDVGEATAGQLVRTKAARTEAERLHLETRVRLAHAAARARVWSSAATTRSDQRRESTP